MRSMSMLQLLGGVAVAGAVAAGTTAFTGSGLDDTAVVGKVAGGGTATVTVTGANLTKASILTDPTNLTRIIGVEVTLDGGTPGDLDDTATAVSATMAGTANGSGTLTCGTGTSNVWQCKVAAPYSTNNFSDVSTFTVNVSPVFA